MNQINVNKERLNKKRISWDKYYIYFITIGMIILCSLINENFLTSKNITNILTQMSFITVAAFAETLLLITGVMDLAIGSTMAVTGMVAVYVYLATGSMVIAMLAAIVAGVVCNAINGLLVNKLHLHPFIVGLGTKQIFRGAILLYTGGVVISQVGDLSKLGPGRRLGGGAYTIKGIVLAMVGLWVILEKTRFGRNAFATGGNTEAARASGINTKKTVFIAYLIAGVFTAVAGVMLMSRLAAGYPSVADGYEMDAMTAAIIGGTSFTGGAGSALGTIVGGLLVGIINNILTLSGVEAYVQQILKGVIIVVAVAIDVNSRRKRMRS